MFCNNIICVNLGITGGFMSKKTSGAMGVMPKSLLRFYLKYGARGHWPLLIAWMVAATVAAAGNVIFPLTERWFIQLFEAAPQASVAAFVTFALPTILLILGLNMLASGSMTLRGMFHARWSPITRNQISETLVDFMHTQSMSFWVGRMSGKVNSQINYVADGFHLLQPIFRCIVMTIMMLVNVGLIFSVNRYVAIVFATVFVLRVVYSIAMFKPVNKASKAASESASTLSGHIIDSLSNYSIVKLFAGARKEHEHLIEPRKRRIKDHIHSFFVQRLMWAIPAFVWDISHATVMLMCVIMFAQGQMLVSEIVFTMSVYFSVMGAIATIVDLLPEIFDKMGAARKSYDELNTAPLVQDAENAPNLVVTRGKIEFKNVSFKYRRKWVLRDLNLVINPGERVGLVGPSGAGKTTLVNLLMRFYDPAKGEILIDGQNIRDVTQDSLRENIAFIPQDPTMFNRSLRENIAYGRPDASDAEIRAAARMASAHDFIMDTDKKYDSLVGDRGIKLSGGQRQRVAIARAFLKNAPILILDEATSALDSETELAIQKSFDELAAGRTTIAIAHRLSTLRNMDRIIVIKDGHIVEQGKHSALLRRRGEYARLWKMQSGGFIAE